MQVATDEQGRKVYQLTSEELGSIRSEHVERDRFVQRAMDINRLALELWEDLLQSRVNDEVPTVGRDMEASVRGISNIAGDLAKWQSSLLWNLIAKLSEE